MGSTPKTTAARQEYKTWHATLVEPHVLLMVEDGDPFVQGLHSVLNCETSRKTGDLHAGKFLLAARERLKDGNCLFLKTADGHWEWVEVKTLANYEGINNFYGRKKNRLENYDASGEATSGTKKIPRMPLVPANVGRKVIEGYITPWEVVLLLDKTMNDKTQAFKDLLNPVMAWALQACCKHAAKPGREADAWSFR